MSVKNWRDLSKILLRIMFSFSLMIVAVFSALAIISHHPLDPSFNLSTSTTEIYNLAGKSGAYFSSLIMQSFGLASFLLTLFFAVSSCKLMFKKSLSFIFLRIIALIFSLIFAAAFLGMFKIFTNWSYIGYGGFAGFYVNKLFVEQLSVPIVFFALITIFTTIVFFLISTDISVQNFLKHCHHAIKFSFKAIFKFSKILITRIFDSLSNWFRKKFFKKRIKDVDITINKKKAFKPKIVQQNQSKKNDDNLRYEFPSMNMMAQNGNRKTGINKDRLSESAKKLQSTLQEFGIKGKINDIMVGPVVTLYQFEPAPGIKSSRIIGLADDVARSMSAVSARISPLPAKNALGIELPNLERDIVFLRDIVDSPDFSKKELMLPLALGKDIKGSNVVADLAKMPHLLVAGTTGSGKSVAINTMILSLVYRLSPNQCKFIMIDPKMLELSVYDGIPHLLSPVITDPKKAVNSLSWVTQEMENRYRLMSALGVRNIAGYNQRINQAIANNESLTRTVQTGFDQDSGKPIYEEVELEMKTFPYIVVIIDEMADLMIVAGKEIESYLQRLAQMARASGIHLIIATQRPSVDVITGVVKANFPTRISFQVTSKIDSRTILGEQGAEQLLGMGDMLYMYSGSKILRVHSPFVSDNEVREIVESIKNQGEPNYIFDIIADNEENDDAADSDYKANSGDEMFDQAVQVIMRDKKVSISYIQRQLKIGYNRAANIVEEMEKQGIISAPNHAGKRDILLGEDNLQQAS